MHEAPHRDPGRRIFHDAVGRSLLLLLVAQLGCGGGSIAANQRADSPAATVTAIHVTPAAASIALGRAEQFDATGIFSDGTSRVLTDSASWSSTNTSVAAISGSGLATSKGTGTTTVTASFGQISGSSPLTVGPPALVAMVITPDNTTISKGTNQQFFATGTFTDDSKRDLSIAVNWSSSQLGVATINNSGLAAGIGIGATVIAAESGAVSGTGALTVSPAVLVSLAVAPVNPSITIGATQRFGATGTFSDGQTQDLTNSASWASSQAAVATVSASGLATGWGTGMTSIAASSGSISNSTTLAVNPPVLVNYFVNANSGLPVDDTVRVTNPGTSGGNLCAMIYVFGEDQKMNECCGCLTTPNGQRTLSVGTDLTNNPLTGVLPKRGQIKIVPSDAASNPSCEPFSLAPAAELRAWSTHLQAPRDGEVAVTETQFLDAPLVPAEQNSLQNTCGLIVELGSGHGTCTCGLGD